MKIYQVNIDISESVTIGAENEEEAKEIVTDMLNQNETIWGIDDAELSVEEITE